jgi:hypothetical protein
MKIRVTLSRILNIWTILNRFIIRDLQSIERMSGRKTPINPLLEEYRTEKDRGTPKNMFKEEKNLRNKPRRSILKREVNRYLKEDAYNLKIRLPIRVRGWLKIEKKKNRPLKIEEVRASRKATKATITSPKIVMTIMKEVGMPIRPSSLRRRNINDT